MYKEEWRDVVEIAFEVVTADYPRPPPATRGIPDISPPPLVRQTSWCDQSISIQQQQIAHPSCIRGGIDTMAFSFGKLTGSWMFWTAADVLGAAAQPQAQAQPTTSFFGASELTRMCIQLMTQTTKLRLPAPHLRLVPLEQQPTRSPRPTQARVCSVAPTMPRQGVAAQASLVPNRPPSPPADCLGQRHQQQLRPVEGACLAALPLRQAVEGDCLARQTLGRNPTPVEEGCLDRRNLNSNNSREAACSDRRPTRNSPGACLDPLPRSLRAVCSARLTHPRRAAACLARPLSQRVKLGAACLAPLPSLSSSRAACSAADPPMRLAPSQLAVSSTLPHQRSSRRGCLVRPRSSLRRMRCLRRRRSPLPSRRWPLRGRGKILRAG